ncbi:MAG: hypothetical protein M1813_006413 [Trichoglossum hirsutum]|nr:MAG: hypothetical protein M1813_006413 [Trichoglossum hirsutum]
MEGGAAQLELDGVRRAQHQSTCKRRLAQGEEPSLPIPKNRRLGKDRQYFQPLLVVLPAMVSVYLLPVVINEVAALNAKRKLNLLAQAYDYGRDAT